MRDRSTILSARSAEPAIYQTIAFDASAALDLLPFRPGKVEGVTWKALQVHDDERGWLCELFRHDDLPTEALYFGGSVAELRAKARKA